MELVMPCTSSDLGDQTLGRLWINNREILKPDNSRIRGPRSQKRQGGKEAGIKET